MNNKVQKIIIFSFIISFLIPSIIVTGQDNETVNETADGYKNNQSKLGQQGNSGSRNGNQPVIQGMTVWLIVISVVIIVVIVSYMLISRNMKQHMKKNMDLIETMVKHQSLEQNNPQNQPIKASSGLDGVEVQSTLLKFLNYHENQVMKKLIEHDGIVLQSEISRIPSMGKVKAHRVLQDLEQKGIIKKEPYGKTNRIILDETIKKIFVSSS
jgi:uncharacterized membrane protein